MIEKKDKEAGYIEVDQPEGVPNVESITKKELDQNSGKLLLSLNRLNQWGIILFLHTILGK